MTQEFVTLPREVVEQALKALQNVREQLGSTVSEFNAIEAIRAALEQPQPPRQPLTEDEIAELMMLVWGCASIAPRQAPSFARAIEQAHNIK